jgi:hypothetical protein
MVFVLDRHKQPLMPCTPKRARLLLARGRAVVHRVKPFVIRLRDRRVEDSTLQPLALKIDPGSKATGIVVARVEETETRFTRPNRPKGTPVAAAEAPISDIALPVSTTVASPRAGCRRLCFRASAMCTPGRSGVEASHR